MSSIWDLRRTALELGGFALIALLLLLVQSALISGLFPWGGYRLGLSALVVTAVAARRGAGSAGRLGLLIGLTSDLFAGRYIGLGAGSYALLGFAAGTVARRVYFDSSVGWMIVSACMGLAQRLIYLLGVAAYSAPYHLGDVIFRQAVPEAVLNALLAAPAYWLVRRGWFGRGLGGARVGLE